MISKIFRMVEDAQGREAPIQRLADSIAGPFVYSVMSLSAATFAFWYFIGTHVFPDVLLNGIAGPEGDPLLLSLKLSVDVLVALDFLFPGRGLEAVHEVGGSVQGLNECGLQFGLAWRGS
ncbi:hypothetical protein F2P56_012786 [Juglans regia]|uniref:Uncharacterized protein n=1 Tax=Juglans regia TaxID=51240 RepID=A0A833XP92_JUGRE|nr:hypothetical protein F2P56_012786 [Juglans regia]